MYNKIAGQSLERICALSDGIFAVAMTLIVLEIRLPHVEIHSEAELWAAFIGLTPQFLTYFLSFLTLGIFWTAQQTQLNFMSRADRDLAWIHFAFLATIAVLPLSTTILAEHISLRLALVFYWLNILLLGALLYASWTHALKQNLIKPETSEALSSAVKRRIMAAQALYAVAMLVGLWNTYLGIGFIALLQLNYAIAPRLGWVYRSL